jgi:trimethylamine:corrinoid methyltransferase-like protein
MAVYSAEVIEQARDFAAGFVLDEDSLGLEEITAAGPGGYFVDSERTYRMFRTAYHTSRIFPRWGMEKWSDEGRPQAEKYLRERTLHLLDNLQPPEDATDLISRGEEMISNL